MRRLKVAVAACAAVTLGVAGCGSPSSNNSQGNNNQGEIAKQENAMDPDAKGPAPEVPGAKKGGTITVYSQSTPDTFDPTNIYYVDGNAVAKLIFRTPTQFVMRNGKPVLVPDLTDLGKPSDDGLSWTFKMKKGMKYEDGTEIKVEDLAYAIKRSFAHDVFADGPTYQLTYFKDAKTYKGPYTSGDNYAGVETPDAETLIVKLDKKFPDLPFYMSFPMFAPIPKAKDTKQAYTNKPLASGPYAYESYTPGVNLKLKKNPNWDAASDPAKHQYPDAWDFKFGVDDVKNQQQILNSNGPDANALNYGNVDATLLPQLTGEKAKQLVKGDSPCTIVVQMDSRKIPLEVRKAIAIAYPYDQHRKARGENDFTAQRASTILPPSVAGYKKYDPLPGLSGEGPGNPAEAKKMLEAAGKVGFQLSWYYDNTSPVTQQVAQVQTDAFKAAGFTVKAIGVASAELRAKAGDYDAPVNLDYTPRGWCSDWPTGTSWFPVLFRSQSIEEGNSWGMLSDPELDKKIDEIAALPSEEQTDKWTALDQEIMSKYVVLPRYYDKMAIVVGTNIGGVESDPTVGVPYFPNVFLKN